MLAAHAAAGTPCVLATVVRCDPPTSAHPGDAAVITADGALDGWIGGSCSEPLVRREALRALADGLPRLVRILPSDAVAELRTVAELTVATTCPSGGALEIFVAPQLTRPLLLVVGGSPAARALAQLGPTAGFRTCAVHPGAQPSDFPGAERVLGSLDLASTSPGGDTWVVVATMGHYDEAALEAALAYPDADVALVASARRGAAVLDNLRAKGVAEADLRRVRFPAGGHRAGRQEQIALLALAEVVTRRLDRRAAAGAPDEDFSAEVPAFATDPVCGMVVEVATSAHAVIHDGVEVHFCCAGCRERFLATPGAFAAATGA